MKLVIKISERVDGGYRASCPSLPGCVVYGSSQVEVKERIEDAIRGYMASLDVALPRELCSLAAAS